MKKKRLKNTNKNLTINDLLLTSTCETAMWKTKSKTQNGNCLKYI